MYLRQSLKLLDALEIVEDNNDVSYIIISHSTRRSQSAYIIPYQVTVSVGQLITRFNECRPPQDDYDHLVQELHEFLDNPDLYEVNHSIVNNRELMRFLRLTPSTMGIKPVKIEDTYEHKDDQESQD